MPRKILASHEVFSAGFFRLRQDRLELNDGRIMPRYYVVEFPDWIHVVALNCENKLILVRQYRHGAQETFIEVPGGSTNPNSGETPEQAAERELLEETGYRPGELRRLGAHYPNPALQNNRMHIFLALNCKRICEPHLDPFEEIEVELHDPKAILEALEKGEILHSLTVSSLALARPYLSKLAGG